MPAKKVTDRPSRQSTSVGVLLHKTSSVRGRGGRGRPRQTFSDQQSYSESKSIVRKSRRTTAGKNPRWREQSVASSSKASRSSRAKPWEGSDDDKDEPRGWGRILPSDEDDSDQISQSSRTFTDDESTVLDYEVATSAPKDDDNIFCPWVELPSDEIPPLELPESSMDLVIDNNILLDSLEIYEVLQNFGSVIQLSPFLYEDFCGALRSPAQSNLLAEIHMAFIKLFFKEEENEHTIFAATETSLSFSIILQLLDHMNFAEILRHYVESDPSFPKEVLNILQNDNYPFVLPDKRKIVLKWMCERFFETIIFRKLVKSGGIPKHEKNCWVCIKANVDIRCDKCVAYFHMACLGMIQQPPDDQPWFCPNCQKLELPGATDSLLQGQTIFRKMPLGYDRHGRIYWFIARRLFIHDLSNNDVLYYSTLPQLYELITQLDSKHYERKLCETLLELLPEIAIQMHTTMALTDERRTRVQEQQQKEFPEPYIHMDNIQQMSRIVAEVLLYEGTNGARMEVDSSVNEGEAVEMDILQKAKSLLCISNGHLDLPIWSGGLDENQLIDYWNKSAEREDESLEQRYSKGFRLAFSDASYRLYHNLYSIDEMLKPPQQRAKEKDKKRYLNQRFSIADDGNFLWTKGTKAISHGNAQEVLNCIKLNIREFVAKIPDSLFHRLWILDDKKEKFMQSLNNSANVSSLKEVLLQFECAVRKPVFLNIWWSGLSLTKFLRNTSDDREIRQKLENQRRKEEKALANADPALIDPDPNIVWVKYSLFGAPPKHNIWKTKDEQYRINGFAALGGWLWVSSTMVRRFLPQAKKPDLGKIKMENQNSMANKKAFRLNRILNRRILWRTLEDLQESSKNARLTCYSASCRKITSSTISSRSKITAFCGYNFSTFNQRLTLTCYNPSCARNQWDPGSTSGIFKAKVPDKEPLKEERGTLGLEKPFPFPKPHDFKSRSGRESILVIPKWYLRRLARQGGINPNAYVPGFSLTAKGNQFVWPYPCSRPLFEHCWRYLTTKANSLHAIALRFRTIYASIRWMDMEPEPDDPDPRVWTHNPDHDEVRTVIGHKEHPPDGYYEQYKIRVDQYSLDDVLNGYADVDADDKDFRHPGVRESTSSHKKRGGRRKQPGRDLKVRRIRKPTRTEERWIDGVELKLYEIAEYWKGYLENELRKRAIAEQPQQYYDGYGYAQQQNHRSVRMLPTTSYADHQYYDHHYGQTSTRIPPTVRPYNRSQNTIVHQAMLERPIHAAQQNFRRAIVQPLYETAEQAQQQIRRVHPVSMRMPQTKRGRISHQLAALPVRQIYYTPTPQTSSPATTQQQQQNANYVIVHQTPNHQQQRVIVTSNAPSSSSSDFADPYPYLGAHPYEQRHQYHQQPQQPVYQQQQPIPVHGREMTTKEYIAQQMRMGMLKEDGPNLSQANPQQFVVVSHTQQQPEPHFQQNGDH